jgi:outer membrane protein assembly factor BamB/tetratricopeptide (TPR) repeat protein
MLVALFGFCVTAQFNPRRVDPRADPNAFTANTQANLDDAMSRIQRLRGHLAKEADQRERAFLIESILEICQIQLNEDSNDSSVIVVERKDLILPAPPTDESVYDLPVRWQGAYSALEAEIRALGEEGLKQYEATYGPRAEALLRDALSAGQLDRVRLINRRFGLTSAGIRAGAVLASVYFEAGDASRAARMLERLLDLRELISVEQRARHSAWVAHCYRDLGERANLARLIQDTVTIREHEVDLGGSKVKLGDLLQEQLLATRDASGDTISRQGVEWPGVNYANTGMHEAPTDYRQAAWTKTLPGLDASPLFSKFMNYSAPMTPPHLPVFDGNRFFVNTGDRLVAYDLIDSGTAAPAVSRRAFDITSSNWRTTEPDPSLILPVSVWRGTVFTALENALHTDHHDRNPERNFGLWSHYPKVRRAMCAIDGASGRLLWKFGGQHAGKDDQSMNFLSGVVHDGTLYAVASRIPGRAEIWLYALNPHNGELIWKLRLCEGQQETTMFGRTAREPHPSLPAIAAGHLYLCSNIGGVVCVDLAARSLRWITRYDYMPRPSAKYIDTYYRDVTWFNNPTMYAEHGGRAWIVVAPTDARKMFAMDARTGELSWEHRQEFQNIAGGRALVGIRGQNVYVAADGGQFGGARAQLHTLDLSTGRVTGSMRVTPADRAITLGLAGRPSMAGGRLLWPGQEQGRSTNVISEIDLDSMRVVNSVNVNPNWRGFSVFAQHGVMFSVSGNDYTRGDNQISVRFNERSLLEQAMRDYKARPQDPEVALRYGLLAMRLGDKSAALAALDSAYQVAGRPPVDLQTRDRAALALVHNYLEFADKELLARKYAEALVLVRNARAYATTRSQLTECFAREEKVLLAKGNASEIEALYQRAVAEDPDFGMGDDPEIPVAVYSRIRLAERAAEAGRAAQAVVLYQQVQEAPGRLAFEGVPLRALAIARMRALIQVHGRDCYAPQDAAAVEQMALKTQDAWRQVLRLYPLSTVASKAALELAHARLKDGAVDDASAIVRSALEENPQRQRVAELQAMQALCLAASGEQLRARLLASRLLREHPDGELTVAGETRAFSVLLKPLVDSATDAVANDVLPRLPGRMEMLWTRPWDQGGYVRLPAQPVVQSTPRFLTGEVGATGISLNALDASTGEPGWSRRSPVTLIGVHRTQRGNLLMLAQGPALFSDDGEELWTGESRGSPEPVSVRGGMLVYGTRSRNTATSRNFVNIHARDVDRGNELWLSEIDGVNALWIEQTSSGVLVLTLGNATTLTLLDIETGAMRAQRSLESLGRVTTQPVLHDGRVLIADRDGKVSIFDAESLAPLTAHESKVRNPTMFRVVEGDYVVVGLQAIGRFQGADGKAVWMRDFTGNEVVTDRQWLGDAVCVTTRTAGNVARVQFYSLADGKLTVDYTVPRNSETDRLDVRQSAAFDGGVLLAFADTRMHEGRNQLWGFRLLALNRDGTERFTWEFETTSTQQTVQLAVIDNYVALTCSNHTFGFGSRE